MSGAVAKMLPDGRRMHFHHGPIDLIISAEGQDQRAAFKSAWQRFQTVLHELTQELSLLRTNWIDIGMRPMGSIARKMYDSVAPHAANTFITPMAAVAGSVAEEILDSMVQSGDLDRAIVNNGGDIAFHLKDHQTCAATLANLSGRSMGKVAIMAEMSIRGMATSGRGGRSYSLGIADSVTVLAKSASAADAAATLIANAVDLPEHPAIARRPAYQLQDDSDLKDHPVVIDCAPLSEDETIMALDSGLSMAKKLQECHLIEAAILFLNDRVRSIGEKKIFLGPHEPTYIHA